MEFCKYCGGTTHEEERKPHIGLFCDVCGKWQKWIPQNQDTGEIASDAQQKYAMSLMEQAVKSHRVLTKKQAGSIIQALKG